jgi:putative membrane protein
MSNDTSNPETESPVPSEPPPGAVCGPACPLRRSFEPALVGFFAFMWAGGILSNVIYPDGLPERLYWTASTFLFLATLIVWLKTPRAQRSSLLVAGGVGFAAELFGVYSRLLFGKYEYGPILQPQLLGVPLVLFCAWLILFAYVKSLLGRVRLGVGASVAVGAGMMVLLDVLIDPVVSEGLRYWSWSLDPFESDSILLWAHRNPPPGLGFDIPLSNFIGWYMVSALIFSLCRKPWPRHPRAEWVGLALIVFFLATGWLTLDRRAAISVAAAVLVAAHFGLTAPWRREGK